MTYNLCRGPSKCTLERRIDKAMRKLDCIAPSRGVSASLHESVPVETIPPASSFPNHLDDFPTSENVDVNDTLGLSCVNNSYSNPLSASDDDTA